MDFDLGKSVAILERTPGVVRALLADLPDDWTRANEGPDTWSPFDVVGHLVHTEETNWMTRVRVILAQGPDRRFPSFERLPRSADEATLAARLDLFERSRAKSLEDLARLHVTPEQLLWTGEHPEFGTVTLSQLLSTWTTHDLSHVAQIARVMAKQHREAVGPWIAYLPVLRR